MSIEQTHTVFVYGTLKQGFGNHVLFGNSTEAKGEGLLIGSYEMVDLIGFPGVVKNPGGEEKVISGEVYAITDETLERLDRLEGNGSFYNREEVEIGMKEGTTIVAWVYFLMDRSDYSLYPLVEPADFHNGSPMFNWGESQPVFVERR